MSSPAYASAFLHVFPVCMVMVELKFVVKSDFDFGFEITIVSRKPKIVFAKTYFSLSFVSFLLFSKKMGKKVTINISFDVMDYCRYTNYQVWKMIYFSRRIQECAVHHTNFRHHRRG